MKPEEVYHQLRELAGRLGITVSEQNLQKTPGIKVESGLCRVRDRQMFIMDKHKTVREKVELLAECLGQMRLDDVYIVPAVRETLDKFNPIKKFT